MFGFSILIFLGIPFFPTSGPLIWALLHLQH